MAPFGATCVLLFAAPESHFSQPRNVIGGHFIAATISVLLWHFLGDQWWVLALGVGTAIAVMQLTKTLHPPAGAHPLVIITGHASWGFIFTPVLLGAITLVLCGIIANNLIKDRHYPRYWW
jgi:CBS-domain-containing membrane protein